MGVIFHILSLLIKFKKHVLLTVVDVVVVVDDIDKLLFAI